MHDLTLRKLNWELSFSVLHLDYWYTCYMLMLGLWNLFLMRLGLCFQGFLALLGFLIMILKTLMFDLWILIHKFKRCFWWKIAKNCQKWLLENSEKFSYASFDWSGIPFDRSNVHFDWLKRNQEPIESGRNSMMKFFIVSIDQEFFSINQILISIDPTRIENQSNDVESLWWISSFFDQPSNRFDRSKALNFEFSLAFGLSVKTLIKSKAMWLIL